MVEQFDNPPITEALLDIRAILPSDIDLEKLLSYHDRIKERFPEKSRRVQWKSNIEIKQESAPEVATSGGPDGYLFKSQTEDKVVQARLDGFTFNKLKPYTCWEEFSSEAKKLWRLYIEVARPEKVTRLTLRYINRIEIPLPIKILKEYVTTVPEIDEKLPNALANFWMRLAVPDQKTGNMAIISETLEPQVNTATIPLVFDIDVYREKILPPDSEEIWRIMESLREYKNKIFLSSMTEKAKELFQ